jgi:tripartite-type tricarboxylate transporter receptor subunit TctC
MRRLTSVLAAIAALAVTSALCGFAKLASAQSWPSRPVQLVIPYPPGGSDALARKLIIGMGERLGGTIIAINKPGASTQIASAHVAQSPPDGHTLYFASQNDLAAGPSLFKSLPFDALTDFTPISYVADAPYALIVAAPVPAKSATELVAQLKRPEGKPRFASYGVQSANDITARRFKRATDTAGDIIPYQGGSPALAAIGRNEVQLIFATLIPTRALIDSGQVRAVAMAAEKRVARYPDVPTLKEAGIDLVDAAGFALMGPKGLPREIVVKVHAALVAELAKPDIQKFLDELGVVPVGSSPAELAARLAGMTAEWAKLVETLGLEKQ